MKVTKYCGEIKAMEQVINWVSPMVMEKARYLKDSVELADLMLAKRELADLITKRDALLRTEQNPTLNEEEVMKTYYISLAAYIVVEVEAETQEAAHQSAGDLLIDSVNDLEDLDCSLVRILDVQNKEELDFVESLDLPDDPVAGLIMLDIHKTQSTTLIIRDDESLLH